MAQKASQRAARARRNRIVAAVAGVAVLAGAVAGGVFLFGPDGTPEALPRADNTSAVPTNCDDPTTLRVAVPPSMTQALAAVTTAFAESPDTPCTTYALRSAEPSAVLASLGTSTGPQAWVTDSSLWIEEAGDKAQKTSAAPFATSGIVVAMPDERAKALGGDVSWETLMTGDQPIRLPDPERSTVGLFSLAAATPAMTGSTLTGAMKTAAASTVSTIDPATLVQADPIPAVPVPEALLADYNRVNPQSPLAAVAPAEATPPLEFSLAVTTTDGATRESVDALAKYLQSDAAQQILVDRGFRVPNAPEPKAPAPLYGVVKIGEAPTKRQIEGIRTLWDEVAPKRQVIAALDVSGSMLERTSEGTRLALAQEALRTAFAGLPDSSRTSLWAFSNHIGSEGDDHKVLTPMGAVGDKEHRAGISAGMGSLDKTVGGGTGLYDSILAAYEAAVKNYAKGSTNVAVVITDGPNDDDFGLDLEMLKGKLASAKDPARPVELVIVGFGDEAPAEELTAAAAAAGGRYDAAADGAALTAAVTRAVTGS